MEMREKIQAKVDLAETHSSTILSIYVFPLLSPRHPSTEWSCASYLGTGTCLFTFSAPLITMALVLQQREIVLRCVVIQINQAARTPRLGRRLGRVSQCLNSSVLPELTES